MPARNLFLATAMAVMVTGGAAIAQSSYASVDGSNDATIIFEAPGLAMRQSVQDMVEDLTAAGFTYIEVRRTFLGRARFIAYTASEMREVVMNPTTGEVLRELTQGTTGKLPGPANPRAQAAGDNGNGNSGNGNGNSGNGNGN